MSESYTPTPPRVNEQDTVVIRNALGIDSAEVFDQLAHDAVRPVMNHIGRYVTSTLGADPELLVAPFSQRRIRLHVPVEDTVAKHRVRVAPAIGDEEQEISVIPTLSFFEQIYRATERAYGDTYGFLTMDDYMVCKREVISFVARYGTALSFFDAMLAQVHPSQTLLDEKIAQFARATFAAHVAQATSLKELEQTHSKIDQFIKDLPGWHRMYLDQVVAKEHPNRLQEFYDVFGRSLCHPMSVEDAKEFVSQAADKRRPRLSVVSTQVLQDSD